MTALRRKAAIVAITAVTAAGIAGCGGAKNSSAGGGKQGGDVNVTMTSFPDYVDPQLSYTVEGWEVLWNTYTPLLTYRHQKGDPGTDVVPGSPRTCRRSHRTAKPTG